MARPPAGIPVDPFVVVSGAVPALLLVAGVLALPVSWWLLRRYRRAVVRGMSTLLAAPGRPAPDLAAVPRGLAARPLRADVVGLSGAGPRQPPASAVTRRAVRDLRRAGLVYITGGAALAVVELVTALLSGTHGVGALALVVTAWVYAWPAVLAYNIVAGFRRHDRWLVLAGYGAVFLVLAVVGIWRGGIVALGQIVGLWALLNVPPTFLLLASWVRAVRAVGPLVLTFMVVTVAGTVLAPLLLGSSETVLDLVSSLYVWLPLPAGWLYLLVTLTALMGFGLVGWGVLRGLGRRYAAKRFSDQSLVVDATMLLFSIDHGLGLMFEGWWWLLSAPAAFAAYKVTVTVLFRLPPGFPTPLPGDVPPRRLLLLRVFALGPRGVRLFDALGRIWLRQGSIAMIAGPDLVTTTVEPHEFLDFLSGRLQRSFVRDESDLRERLATLDHGPDPDGRHRVNELFCVEDTWRVAVDALVRDSDAVLMDLRGFSPGNQGCSYELGLLLDVVPLSSALLVVDASTDEPFLWHTLQRLWGQLWVHSPNAGPGSVPVRIWRAGTEISRDAEGIMRVLTPSPPGAVVPVAGAVPPRGAGRMP